MRISIQITFLLLLSLLSLAVVLIHPPVVRADGIVHVVIKGNDIIVAGDNNDNQIQFFNTGGGNDGLYFGKYQIVCDKPEFNDKLTVKMGGDDDTVTMECDSLKDVSAVLSGGGGTDTITPEPAVLETQGVKVKGFEQ